MSGVLIVDDDDALTENMAEILSTLPIETATVRDRKGALAISATRDFDVALIDVRLPDGDGASLLEPLRARSPFTQLVLVTGNATLEGAMAAVRGAAFAYVLKPVTAPDLIETVRRAVAQAGLYRERERLRLELERSERRHRELVESVPAYVLALDQSGRITTWNRQLEETTGYLRNEMLGAPGLDLVGTDEMPRPLPLKNGDPPRQVRWRRAEVHGPDGNRMTYALGIDVTDEQEMLRRTMRAERLAAVGTMAAGLAHEVRNPLNSAALQLSVLERRLEKSGAGESTLPIAGIIRGEIERLDRLVREFLTFAQPRPLAPAPVAVGALLDGVAALIRPEAEAAGITVVVEPAAAGARLFVAGEAERLRQVLLNLTRNAIEAMHGAHGRLALAARSRGQTVEIDVSDTGPGFSNDLPVFDAFFTTKPHGTGLGLARVHRIVTDHGGTIRVRSTSGDTCFTVTLPAAEGTGAGAGAG
jgi:signal transduction histidine kinase